MEREMIEEPDSFDLWQEGVGGARYLVLGSIGGCHQAVLVVTAKLSRGEGGHHPQEKGRERVRDLGFRTWDLRFKNF